MPGKPPVLVHAVVALDASQLKVVQPLVAVIHVPMVDCPAAFLLARCCPHGKIKAAQLTPVLFHGFQLDTYVSIPSVFVVGVVLGLMLPIPGSHPCLSYGKARFTCLLVAAGGEPPAALSAGSLSRPTFASDGLQSVGSGFAAFFATHHSCSPLWVELSAAFAAYLDRLGLGRTSEPLHATPHLPFMASDAPS